MLSSREQVVQHELSPEGEYRHRATKVGQRDESFGVQAKRRFCQMWHRAKKVVSDDNLLMNSFVKVTGRYQHHLRAALQGETQWQAEIEAACKSAQGRTAIGRLICHLF
jgi:hypothetical protein